MEFSILAGKTRKEGERMNAQTEKLLEKIERLYIKQVEFYANPPAPHALAKSILQACKEAGLTWYMVTDREDKFIPIDFQGAQHEGSN